MLFWTLYLKSIISDSINRLKKKGRYMKTKFGKFKIQIYTFSGLNTYAGFIQNMGIYIQCITMYHRCKIHQ